MFYLLILFVIIFAIVGLYFQLTQRRKWVQDAYEKLDSDLRKKYELIQEICDHHPAKDEGLLAKSQILKFKQHMLDRKLPIKEKMKLDHQMNDQFSKMLNQYADEIDSEKNAELQLNQTQLLEKSSDFNDAVESYNNTVTMFPFNIFAKLFRFQKVSHLEVLSA